MTLGISASASVPDESRPPSRTGGTAKPRGIPPGPTGKRS